MTRKISFLVMSALVLTDLSGCATSRNAYPGSTSRRPESDLKQLVVTTMAGRRFTGKIVGLKGDCVVFLQHPYWKVNEVYLDLDQIWEVEEAREASPIKEPLACYFGLVGGSVGFIAAGKNGLATSEYDVDYQRAMRNSILIALAAGAGSAALGLLAGMGIESLPHRVHDLRTLSREERIRKLEEIAGITGEPWTGRCGDADPAQETLSGLTEHYRAACAKGDMMGCYNLGVGYRDGVGIPENKTTAASLFQRACEAGVMKGCLNLGLQYCYGQGVERDPGKGISMFRKACKGGIVGACGKLAVWQDPEAPEAPEALEAPEAPEAPEATAGEEPSPADRLPDPPDCPAGTRLMGSRPPGGYEQYCAGQAAGGELVKHGPYTSYHEGGSKAGCGSYAQGARHGSWTFWYPDGTVRLRAEFHRGRSVGTWIHYSRSGEESRRVKYGR